MAWNLSIDSETFPPLQINISYANIKDMGLLLKWFNFDLSMDN